MIFGLVVLGHKLSSKVRNSRLFWEGFRSILVDNPGVRNCKWDTSSVLVDEPKFK